jgi:hypothetical protein
MIRTHFQEFECEIDCDLPLLLGCLHRRSMTSFGGRCRLGGISRLRLPVSRPTRPRCSNQTHP